MLTDRVARETVNTERRPRQGTPMNQHLQRLLAHTQVGSLLDSHETMLRDSDIPQLVTSQLPCRHGQKRRTRLPLVACLETGGLGGARHQCRAAESEPGERPAA